MSDEAGSSTPSIQSKLARARAGRGSMLGPTPAAKKLAKPVPFGGVQTLPRRSPDASRSLIQATSRLSRNLTSPTSSQVQLSSRAAERRFGGISAVLVFGVGNREFSKCRHRIAPRPTFLLHSPMKINHSRRARKTYAINIVFLISLPQNARIQP